MKEPSRGARGRPRGFDRDEALEIAMELFWARGYETTSLADLTSALGIAPASFYAAFGSKEKLFFEAVERYDAAYGALDPDDLEGVRGARAMVEKLLYGATEAFTAKGKPRGCMVISAATNCGPGSAAVEAAMRRQRIANEKFLERRFASAVVDGELPKDADPRALAKYVATVFQGMSVQARDGASRAELRAVAELALAALPASGDERVPPTATARRSRGGA
ncbi:MAG: TetR/AcrR family transcriptional regulator [Labilithrix sp.]|nr:TetR/AcrR family transcriptional regulator [Labilithrix sp.]